MKVDKNNYESLLIDYLDGVLDPLLKEDLFVFINASSELKAELDILLNIQQLKEPEIGKIDFNFLKKPELVEPDNEIEELMLASIENNLEDPEQQNLLNRNFILYPELTRHFELFKLIKLQPDMQIVFENKQLLKRKQATVIPMFYKFAAVAAVFLFIGFSWLFIGQKRSELPRPSQLSAYAIITKKSLILPTHQPKNNAPVTEKELGVKKNSKVKTDDSKTALALNRNIVPLTLNEIGSKKITIIKTEELPALVSAPCTPCYKHELQSEERIVSHRYFTTKYWLAQKLKQQVPLTEDIVDTLLNGGVKLAALHLLNKTTGVSYTQKKDQNGSKAGFSIVSKYFAIERTAHD